MLHTDSLFSIDGDLYIATDCFSLGFQLNAYNTSGVDTGFASWITNKDLARLVKVDHVLKTDLYGSCQKVK